MDNREVTLFHKKDDSGSEHIGAEILPNGELCIGTQYLGRSVSSAFGAEIREYETELIVPSSGVSFLMQLLGEDGDVLDALQRHFSDENARKLSSFLTVNQVPFRTGYSRIGD